ncbi:MAG: GNAT family N-acetyltransferase [bacterium]
MVIIRAKINELKVIGRITKRAYVIPYHEQGPAVGFYEDPLLKEKYENKELGILAAKEKGKIIGTIRYRFPDKKNLYFFRLAVLKTHRKQGVGAKLVRAVEQLAKKHGCQKVLLDCMVEKGLVAYYQQLGYKVDKKKKHHDHHDAFMSKNLK